ncbi:GNAT family N-acetyltransferase [Paenibacillus tengchongensis]|uniref:GNAT family N-acetyltransferase n=1 Tax=Paenibacillus tengchongensis TaxID=2608684 RepID=UPI001651ED48|nr:GNAT family N-acetyltransferase [Paenibacillus tengchongensis]
MRVIALEEARKQEFLEYCRRNRSRLDESFLYDEDLEKFSLSPENPTYIAVDPQGILTGAVSLILGEYRSRGRKGRFRILHAEKDRDSGVYSALLQAVLPHTAGCEKLNVFVPTVHTDEMERIIAAGFAVERYSYILVRENTGLPEPVLPEGYALVPFRPGCDEAAWCEVRNRGFAKLQGSEAPQAPETVGQMAARRDYLEGGMLMLRHEGKPVGIVRGAADEYEGVPAMNIGPLALLPEYQGKGLGRLLLRAALRYADGRDYGRTMLCVNAENERAKALYTSEGFREAEAAACYAYYLQD